jgi:methyl-accepting chemotaxis protein
MPLDAQQPAGAGAASAQPDERLAFLRIDPATQERVRRLQPVVHAALPAIADEFYGFVGRWPVLAEKLGGAEHVAQLRKTQAEHWEHLFSGRLDAAYRARAETVGRVHERIGLEPRWYIGGYTLIIERLMAVLIARHRGGKELAEDLGALLRIAMLDLDLAVSTYITTGDSNRVRDELLAMCDVLDRELETTAGEISAQASKLADGAESLIRVAGEVLSMTEAVGSTVKTTAQTIGSVASAASELEASSRDINAMVERATGIADTAMRQADDAAGTVSELNTTATRIGEVVGLVRGIAGQTKLLALNATIEAARAGEAGRGFAVVATEVKTLARETETAIARVNSQAVAIGRSAELAGSAVGGIGEQIRAVGGIAQQVAQATAQQRAATEEIARSVEVAAREGKAVAAQADDLQDRALIAEAGARSFKSLSMAVSDGVADIRRRMSTILRASAAGNRRASERQPIGLHATLAAPGFSASGATADLSMGGALFAVKAPDTLRNARITADLEGLPRLSGRVVAVSNLGVHVQFDALDAKLESRLAEVLAAAKALDGRYIALCQETAAKVAEALAGALREGAVSVAALFDLTYRPIPGTDPPQVLTDATPICERLLPPIIDAVKDGNPNVVFCAPCDRGGYIAAHNREYSKPQRPGDTEWNKANSRNRRVFEDRAGLLAARNALPSLLQSYPRDLGGGRIVTLKEYDAPIRVNNQHWGALRLAVKP